MVDSLDFAYMTLVKLLGKALHILKYIAPSLDVVETEMGTVVSYVTSGLLGKIRKKR